MKYSICVFCLLATFLIQGMPLRAESSVSKDNAIKDDTIKGNTSKDNTSKDNTSKDNTSKQNQAPQQPLSFKRTSKELQSVKTKPWHQKLQFSGTTVFQNRDSSDQSSELLFDLPIEIDESNSDKVSTFSLQGGGKIFKDTFIFVTAGYSDMENAEKSNTLQPSFCAFPPCQIATSSASNLLKTEGSKQLLGINLAHSISNVFSTEIDTYYENYDVDQYFYWNDNNFIIFNEWAKGIRGETISASLITSAKITALQHQITFDYLYYVERFRGPLFVSEAASGSATQHLHILKANMFRKWGYRLASEYFLRYQYDLDFDDSLNLYYKEKNIYSVGFELKYLLHEKLLAFLNFEYFDVDVEQALLGLSFSFDSSNTKRRKRRNRLFKLPIRNVQAD